MATSPPRKKPKKTAERERFTFDLPDDVRQRFERAAGKLHMNLSAFLRLAAEEKIRRDGLGD